MTSTPAERYRLVTRSDFDGLVCAALLKHLGMLDDILFVHPKDVQDGKVEMGPNDVTTNLPYNPDVAISFDHHHSETIRVGEPKPNHVIVPGAESAARVVYEYYGGAETFPGIEELMDAVDKGDAAQFSLDEILKPTGWVLLNFLMDPRTGLGRFRDFRISNYQLMMQLIDVCTAMSIEEILETPDVKERVELYFDARRGRRGADPALRDRARQPGGARPPRGGGHPPHEPLHAVRAVPASATSRSTCCGACASRTRCSRPASRSSTGARRRTSAS